MLIVIVIIVIIVVKVAIGIVIVIILIVRPGGRGRRRRDGSPMSTPRKAPALSRGRACQLKSEPPDPNWSPR